MKKFQIIFIGIFILLAAIGVLVLSGTIPIGNKNAPGALGEVTLWGSINSETMRPLLTEFNATNPAFILKYVEKGADVFDRDLLEALADGAGPDMILLPDNLAFQYKNRLVTIPFESYPIASFQANFAGAGNVFLTSQGMFAFPITIDPLMMYFNRSILDANGVVYPPASWDELVALVPTLTKKDESNKIVKSAIALGHFANVNNAKDILSALFMQGGSSIVSEQGGRFFSSLAMSNETSTLDDALKFYTDFADPNKSTYSWNRSLPASNDLFSSENEAFYLGFGSELQSLVNKNPNQNFGIAPIPQLKGVDTKITSSRVLGVAVMSSTRNFNTAFTAASLLSSGSFASRLASVTGTAPARRDLLNAQPGDIFSPIIYKSALFARSWIDPSKSGTDTIFKNMIEGIISSTLSLNIAIGDADSKLNFLLLK